MRFDATRHKNCQLHKVCNHMDDSSYRDVWGFNDLHAFKDFLSMVILCAPDQFFEEDFLPADQQLNLERAFEGLEHGFRITAEETGKASLVESCRRLAAEALTHYQSGRDMEGQRKLEEAEALIRYLPSK